MFNRNCSRYDVLYFFPLSTFPFLFFIVFFLAFSTFCLHLSLLSFFCGSSLFACNLSVLRIRDVYHWSWILIFFPSWIPKNSNWREGQCCGSIRCLFYPWICDPEIGFFRITPDLGSWIQNPYFYVLWFFVKTYSGSQIQGSKRRWIPDPGIYTDPVRRDPTLTGSGSTLLFIIVSFHFLHMSSPSHLFYCSRAMQCGVYICFDETLYPNRGYGYGFRIFIKGMLLVLTCPFSPVPLSLSLVPLSPCPHCFQFPSCLFQFTFLFLVFCPLSSFTCLKCCYLQHCHISLSVPIPSPLFFYYIMLLLL